MNQDEDKLIALAQKLLDNIEKATSGKGKSGLTNWRETSEENSFQTSVENASIWISGDEVSEKYSIAVRNRIGTIVASLTCRSTDYSGYSILKRLYDLARRDALKVDQTINDLLQRLS